MSVIDAVDSRVSVLDDPDLRDLDGLYREDEVARIKALSSEAQVSADVRARIFRRSVDLIRRMRHAGKPGLMDLFLAEYGLSTDEGLALMCLAEALLRVPDPDTIDRLIEDKIAPQEWGGHLGKSPSTLVNVSTIGLMLTGQVLEDEASGNVAALLNRLVKRLGEPVIRVAVRRAMRELGGQFVLGQTIEAALRRGEEARKKGYLYSYDMLGEAALTQRDAEFYFDAYAHAIRIIGRQHEGSAIEAAPGISVKLSALHPRFELAKASRLVDELVPRVVQLARAAKAYGLGFTIDAEEADRLDPSLRVFAALLKDQTLSGWDGLGLAVQAYGKRAAAVIDWLYGETRRCDRRIMVRLVKGAYWDTEIKRAQVEGVEDFPVFTCREATDISYICCAKKLFGMADRIYPQFATHNAQTAASVLEMVPKDCRFEFQRLHGMGEALHRLLLNEEKARCRIYAPVGPHQDLLAYLVRRLLENGANSSFVNQVVDPRQSAEEIAEDPFDRFEKLGRRRPSSIRNPTQLFAPERRNSSGWTLGRPQDVEVLDDARAPYREAVWDATPITAAEWDGDQVEDLYNPARPDDRVGQVTSACPADAERAIHAAQTWLSTPARFRAETLNRASDLLEENVGELMALLGREAGKTQADAIAEIREAVDFLRYYAQRSVGMPSRTEAGIVTCISPWNFPLAIFIGQVAAALAAGNGVLAKPAEATPLIASFAVKLLHQAGVPRAVLQYLPGAGPKIGQILTANPIISGVCFTGSTATAQIIHRSLANFARPDSFFIAETGGLNAAMVDSTALLEQAVRDTVQSAFMSAGQRCSALRCIYVQDDIADDFLAMLRGSMDQLQIGDPWLLSTDVGPVISPGARDEIQAYVEDARTAGKLLQQIQPPGRGNFVGPSLISVDGVGDLTREIFGPVLHVARFKASEADRILDRINETGYGLTFGLHTRIDGRVRSVADRLKVGNIYVNRNQIGAVVGSQPFGGEGLSGTGPKAGGPAYVRRFVAPDRVDHGEPSGSLLGREVVQRALDSIDPGPTKPLSRTHLPGPTGETNELSVWPRGTVLCLGPTLADGRQQAEKARALGCPALLVASGATSEEGLDGQLDLEALGELRGISVVALWGDDGSVRRARRALAQRSGPVVPLVCVADLESYCAVERHLCVDTTAAGGNATLLGGGSLTDVDQSPVGGTLTANADQNI